MVMLARIAVQSGCSAAYSVACFVACGASNAVSYGRACLGLQIEPESCVSDAAPLFNRNSRLGRVCIIAASGL